MTATYSKDGYLFFREVQNKPEAILGDRLIINPTKVKDSVEYAKKNGIKAITINPVFFKVNTLDFLEHFSFIEGLYLLQDGLNLEPIHYLKNLRVLTFSDPKAKIDLGKFLNLEVLGLTYNKNVHNLDSCKKLFWLWVEKFNKTDLTELRFMTRLQYLSLYKAAIINLEGLGHLSNLVSLKIDSAHSLLSLSGISSDNICLRVIDIYNAKNLVDYKALSNANSIEKIWIRKTGNIPDVHFLKKMERLKDVAIGSKINDGDISVLEKIPFVNFLDFSHYNLTMKALKQQR